MSDWKEIEIKDIVLTANTGLDAIRRAPIVESSTGIKCLRIQDVSQNKKYDDWGFTKVEDRDYIKFQLKKDDIIIARTGASIGVNKYIVQDLISVFNNGLIRIRTKADKCFPLFLYYNFRTQNYDGFIENISGGTSTQPNMQINVLLSFNIFLPPLPEQKAIVGVLSSLDDKIDLLHRQNKTLEAMAETLFRQWFVEEKDEEWEKCKLGDILEDIQSGSRPKGGIDPELKEGIPSIGAENINGLGFYDFSKTKFVNFDFYKKSKRGIIKNYDVLVYKDGAYIGRKGMFANGFPYKDCMINEHVFVLRSNKKANQLFLYFLLDQEELQLLNANSAQPGLNQASMKSFDIVLPPKDRIDEFEKITKDWIDKIFFNSNQILTLEKLRDTLLPKLMSGEVRVNV